MDRGGQGPSSKGSTVGPRHLAAILTASLSLGLVATACSSTSSSTTSTSTTPASASARANAAAATPFLSQLHPASQIASTVPAKGDVNPYGVARRARTRQARRRGNVLVSNFNDKANVQGTGTTIVQVSPGRQVHPVRRPGQAAGRNGLPGRRRPDHRARHPARRLGGRREPARPRPAARCRALTRPAA